MDILYGKLWSGENNGKGVEKIMGKKLRLLHRMIYRICGFGVTMYLYNLVRVSYKLPFWEAENLIVLLLFCGFYIAWSDIIDTLFKKKIL